MKKNFSSALFKRSMQAVLVIAALISLFPCALYAKKPTTYLAPQYQVPLSPENAFISVAPMADSAGQPESVNITSEFEKLEVARQSGFKVAPFAGGGEYAKDVIPYLMKSEEMLDSAKLRVIARMVKYDLIKKSGNEKYAEFYKQYINSPIACFIGLGLGTGPACGQIPAYLPLKDGKNFFFSTLTIIEDIPKMFLVADAIKNDTFDLVVAHENAHGIMFDMYGSQMGVIEKKSNMGHDGPVISDRGLAYLEGWAEAFEALYGPTNPLLKLKEEEREKYRISEFLFTRQDPVRRDRYIWQTTKKKTGVLKNGLQIISTEGAVAGVFYDILTSRAIKDPFVKSVSVMYLHRPKDFIGFIKGWVKEFAEDKRVLYRIFLEGTNYATVSNKARGLYHDYYQAKLKYVQKTMDQKTFYDIKNKWTVYKEDLFNTVMKQDNIDANIGPDLWMKVGVIPAAPQAKDLNINISTVTPDLLSRLKLNGLSEEDIIKMIQAREAMGVLPFKTASEALKNFLGDQKANQVMTENKITDM
jgi:hypothetical protein